jgi:uncharacterized RDD family membrane protein YckC
MYRHQTAALPRAVGGPSVGQHQDLASWWRRLLAFVIDCLVLTLATGALWGRLVAFFANRLSSEQSAYPDGGPHARAALGRVFTQTTAPYLIVLGFTICVAVVYYWLLTGYWGATIGKRSLGIWVVRTADGSPVSLRASFLRAVIFVAGGEAVPFFFLADNLWLTADPLRQCLHDKAAGTVVVRRPAHGRPGTG